MKSFDFNKNVIERSKSVPVIVEFSFPGCGPCVWMEKMLVDIVRQSQGKYEFVSLPINDFPDAQKAFDLTSNPTTIVFVNGKAKAQLKGALPKIVIQQWLNDHAVM